MTRSGLRGQLTALAGFIEGVRECAAAGRAGRMPSREALKRLGLDSTDGSN